jgi:hypothetical protein
MPNSVRVPHRPQQDSCALSVDVTVGMTRVTNVPSSTKSCCPRQDLRAPSAAAKIRVYTCPIGRSQDSCVHVPHRPQPRFVCTRAPSAAAKIRVR